MFFMSFTESAQDMRDELVQLRHSLHTTPELGLALPRTQEKVLAALDGLPLEITLGSGLSSITAVLLASDRRDEAQAVADELRRTRPDVSDCLAMAEVFETAGDLAQASRWTAIGLARIELSTDDELDAGEAEQLLVTRSRIRTAQGLPPE